MASPCISKAHQEYHCLTRYGVTGKKFTAEKWCDPCRELFADEIASGRIISSPTKKKRKTRGTA